MEIRHNFDLITELTLSKTVEFVNEYIKTKIEEKVSGSTDEGFKKEVNRIYSFALINVLTRYLTHTILK